MTKPNSPDSSSSQSTPDSQPELSLTPPRVQRPKAPEAKAPETLHKPQKPVPPPMPKAERGSRSVPKPRKIQDGPKEAKVEKPEPVPEYGDRKAGDEMVLPYSGRTVQISHFYQSSGHWYAAFEVGCVRVDVLETLS